MPEFAERQRQTGGSHLVSPAKPDRTTPRPAHAANPNLAQQQALGNQAVQRLARSCPVFPSRCPFGGACHTCPALVQAKLKVGQPGHKYEQEADRVAEQVMHRPEPRVQRQGEPEEEEEETLQTKPLAAQITLLVQRQVEPEEEEEEEELIQAKQASGKTPQAGSRLEAQIRSLRGGGQPLPESARNYFEPCFGYDFSQVRVHTGNSAAKAAQVVNARAFTVGRDVVFGAEQYAPGTAAGRRLLAHELTHVVQQRGATLAGLTSLSTNRPGDRYEQEADQVATTATRIGENLPSATYHDARVRLSHPPVVQRVCKGRTRTRNAIVSNRERDYQLAVRAGRYCRDTGFTGLFHRGKTCYREVPRRSRYTECPPGDQVCFDHRTGKCEDSHDKVSPVEKQNADGSCNLHFLCSALHAKTDVVPWMFPFS